MEIEVIEKRESPLLSRVEISFRVIHPKESTPKRSNIREELATQMNVKKSCVIIDNMKAEFGKSETIGFAKIYSSDKEAKAIERKYILTRNKLESGGESKKEKKAEPKPEAESKPETETDSADDTNDAKAEEPEKSEDAAE